MNDSGGVTVRVQEVARERDRIMQLEITRGAEIRAAESRQKFIS